jgi:hypothetical protein
MLVSLARNPAMIVRRLPAAVLCAALLFAPIAAIAADRGPSTPEERKQALEYIHNWQADPLGPNAKEQFGWVLKWFADVPDQTVHVCMILDKLPRGNKKDSSTIFGGETMAQAAFVLEHPEKKSDLEAEYEAGVDGALNVYAGLVKANEKDRQPYLDDLLQRRDAGTLAQFVRERATSACSK